MKTNMTGKFITLTAMCMIMGTNSLKSTLDNLLGVKKDTLSVANTTAHPVEVKVKFVYKKMSKGIEVTRHQDKSVKLTIAGSSTGTTDSMKYPTTNSSVVEIKTIYTDSGKSVIKRKNKGDRYQPLNISIIDNAGNPTMKFTTR